VPAPVGCPSRGSDLWVSVVDANAALAPVYEFDDNNLRLVRILILFTDEYNAKRDM